MIFWLVLKLEICIEFIIYLEIFWFLLEEFFLKLEICIEFIIS